MLQTIEEVIEEGLLNWAKVEFSKGWKFAETHWYCNECGFVSTADVERENESSETGICRCGRAISQSPF